MVDLWLLVVVFVGIDAGGMQDVYVFDNPNTDNDFGAEGAKHLKLPANLQTLNLERK